MVKEILIVSGYSESVEGGFKDTTATPTAAATTNAPCEFQDIDDWPGNGNVW